ncbi:MAG: nucleoside monophosphate kinase, partial [Bacteroidaceae bacterium]|nr:nucleoside monophosphate kinase [Bacteroidaceae bacterium]
MDNIVIFGAPGSGKGTYSAALVEKFGYYHISTGDVLRAEIREGSELGRIAEGYIEKGQLIPDDLIIDMLARVYDTMRDGPGVIFDGFPRTIVQAKALKEMLQERGEKISVTLNLIVSEDILMQRL